MKTTLRLTACAAALCCAGAAADAMAATTRGTVVGAGYYRNALVCIDRNANGRCDAGEASATTDAQGAFALEDSGPLVAEIAADRGQRALVLRAPAGSAALSGITTELVALTEAHGGNAAVAQTSLAARLDVPAKVLLADPLRVADPATREALLREVAAVHERIADARAEAGSSGSSVKPLRDRLALDEITNVIVIYAENRSFDNVFGTFPGANGLRSPAARALKQVDRNLVTELPVLPPAWGGLTAPGQTPAVSAAQTTNVWPNAPFQIDAKTDHFGYGVLPNSIITRDLYHRFFENVMQIDGGRSDAYVAWGDSGGTVMGYFDGSRTQLWQLAQRYTLADNFFQAAYGGSFLNHQYLVCACAPSIPADLVAANGFSVNVLGTPINGVPQLAANPSQTASALDGPTSLRSGNLAPLDYFGPGDGYRGVNTLQAPFQPSGNKPADIAHALFADPHASTTVPPQTQTHIGDLLDAKNVSWAWYSGGWAAAVAEPYPYDPKTGTFGTSTTIYNANGFGTADAKHSDFQPHHQPLNYFADLDPVDHAAARAAHLKDRADLLADIQAGTLPSVVFYKPVGYQNEHPGYASLTEGDSEIAAIVQALQAGPQWQHLLILVTYDEFGGQFDHVAPPAGDLLGPGTRIPAVVISPYAKKGFVDHTAYDTASFLRFITHRWSLPVLDGLQQRDDALAAHGQAPLGDLTNALSF